MALDGLQTTPARQSSLDWFFELGKASGLGGGAPVIILTDRAEGSYPVRLDGTPAEPLAPSFSVGKPVNGVFQPIVGDSDVKIGDTLRVTYRLKVPWLQDWQTGALASRLARDDRLELHYVALNEENRNLRIEATVRKAFSPAIFIAAAIAAVAVGIGIWIATESIEKLTTIQNPFDPDKKINVFPILAVAALAIFGVPFLFRALGSRSG